MSGRMHLLANSGWLLLNHTCIWGIGHINSDHAYVYDTAALCYIIIEWIKLVFGTEDIFDQCYIVFW